MITRRLPESMLLPIAAQSLLVILYARAVERIAGVVPLLAVLALAAVAGHLLGRGRLRAWVVALIALCGSLLAYAIMVGVLGIIVRSSASISVANLLGRVDALSAAAIPVVLVSFTSALVVQRAPRAARWEPVLHALLVVALLWSQAHYELSYFARPWAYVLVVGGLVTIDAVILLEPRARRRSILRAALVAVPLLVLAMVLAVAWYTSGGTQAGGGILRPTLFRFDFAPFVRLESEISMSDDLVLLYRRSGHPRRDLIRRYVLSDYDARRGFSVGEVADDLPAQDAERERVEQEFFLVNLDPQTRLALNAPVSYVQFENWDDSSFTAAFRAESLVSTAPPLRLARVRQAAVADDGTIDVDPRLVDYGDNEAIHALALEVTSDVTGPFAKARAIEEYLKQNYFYSLRPGIAADGDRLDYFLFQGKKGYCSYFAFSMALMVRSLGIPARVAVGFFVDPSQEVLNFQPILANMAHAWVEVRIGEYGWISFDPTSQTLAPGEDFELGQGADPDELARLLEEILSQDLRPLTPMPAEETPAGGTGAPRFVLEALTRWYLIVPALFVLYLVLIRVRWHVRIAFARSLRERIRLQIRRLLDRLWRCGIRRRHGESLTEFGARVAVPGVDAVMQIYEQVLFAERVAEGAEREAVEAVARAQRGIRMSIPFTRRLLAVVDPRPAPRRVHG